MTCKVCEKDITLFGWHFFGKITLDDKVYPYISICRECLRCKDLKDKLKQVFSK